MKWALQGIKRGQAAVAKQQVSQLKQAKLAGRKATALRHPGSASEAKPTESIAFIA
jgi:hypothetical protein